MPACEPTPSSDLIAIALEERGNVVGIVARDAARISFADAAAAAAYVRAEGLLLADRQGSTPAQSRHLARDVEDAHALRDGGPGAFMSALLADRPGSTVWDAHVRMRELEAVAVDVIGPPPVAPRAGETPFEAWQRAGRPGVFADARPPQAPRDVFGRPIITTGPTAPDWTRQPRYAALEAALARKPIAMRSGAGVTSRGPGQLISLTDANSDAKQTWNQIAKSGDFAGHPAGPFRLDVIVFREIVRNFHATQNRRIPIDYEHASEADETKGSIPTSGAPAIGWIVDLRVEASDLFGLVEWLEPARSQIRTGAYRYISPAVRLGCVDRVTGKPIGARLTSCGLTNSPFLDGMIPLAAKDGGAR